MLLTYAFRLLLGLIVISARQQRTMPLRYAIWLLLDLPDLGVAAALCIGVGCGYLVACLGFPETALYVAAGVIGLSTAAILFGILLVDRKMLRDMREGFKRSNYGKDKYQNNS